MSQEATMIAVDNSDFMRNGDFVPTRLQAQNDAVSLVCQCKRQGNPENTFGLISLAKAEVLCTLTNDVSKIYNRLHLVHPNGNISFCTAVKVAHLALRHRQLRHQKMRIVVFVGSPIEDDEKDMIKLAKRLKKEKVNVDIVNFGEDEFNQKRLLEFVDTVNGKDAGGSHLVTVPPGTMLHDSLVTSPIVAGEDGTGGPGSAGLGLEFGLDAAEDPDLLYALRVSMEDQRMRQEHEQTAGGGAVPPVPAALPGAQGTSEEEMLRQALAMSMEVDKPEDAAGGGSAGGPTSSNNEPPVDLAAMTEEEQINYVLRMSMQPTEPSKKAEPSKESMDVDKAPASGSGGGTLASALAGLSDEKAGGTSSGTDAAQAGYDKEFLSSVLRGLPGVDADNAEVKEAISSLTGEDADKKKQESKKKEDGADK